MNCRQSVLQDSFFEKKQNKTCIALEIFRKTCQQFILVFKGEGMGIISTRLLPAIFQSRSLWVFCSSLQK